MFREFVSLRPVRPLTGESGAAPRSAIPRRHKFDSVAGYLTRESIEWQAKETFRFGGELSLGDGPVIQLFHKKACSDLVFEGWLVTKIYFSADSSLVGRRARCVKITL
jgi:hypothetical protein